MTAYFYHVTYAFQSESRMASLPKWLSVHLRAKWLWVRVPLQSISIQCVTCSSLLPLVVLIYPLIVLVCPLTACLSTCSTCAYIRLSTRNTCLSTRSICLSTRSTHLAICLSTCSTRSAIC